MKGLNEKLGSLMAELYDEHRQEKRRWSEVKKGERKLMLLKKSEITTYPEGTQYLEIYIRREPQTVRIAHSTMVKDILKIRAERRKLWLKEKRILKKAFESGKVI